MADTEDIDIEIEAAAGNISDRNGAAVAEVSTNNRQQWYRETGLPFLVFSFGTAASLVILWLGISASNKDQLEDFNSAAKDMCSRLSEVWATYTMAGLWLVQSSRGGKQSRQEFMDCYEYLRAAGLEFDRVSWIPNATEAKRPYFEGETRKFLQTYHPEALSKYHGFWSFTRYDNGTVSTDLVKRSFYFPIQYVEPHEKHLESLGLDLYNAGYMRPVIEETMSSRKPVLTGQLPCVTQDCVALLHPGIKLSNDPENRLIPSLALFQIRLPVLISDMAIDRIAPLDLAVYLYDTTFPDSPANFLNAAIVRQKVDRIPSSMDVDVLDSSNRNLAIKSNKDPTFDIDYDAFYNKTVWDEKQPYFSKYHNHIDYQEKNVDNVQSLSETTIEEARASGNRYVYNTRMKIASREWTVVIVAQDDEYEPELGFILLGSIMIFVACLCLALWMWTSRRREAKMSEMRLAAKAEKDAIVVKNARMAAKRERELNDFIAHEVRNPLSAAMSAYSFVNSAVHEEEPLRTDDSRVSVRDDLEIIGTSLEFMNDLLRNMLELHRASSNQLKLKREHVDVLQDVLDPAASMIYHRSSAYEVIVECPQDLVIMADKLCLKQIVLNLGRNAAKFVQKGFVKLAGRVDAKGFVEIMIEDSGPGIPEEKRSQLFKKFQESLDTLNQGTGIGLAVCNKLIDSMGGEVILDSDYRSGVEGCPGARFIVKLKTPVVQNIDLPSDISDTANTSSSQMDTASFTTGVKDAKHETELPESLSVLFVDDELTLRKLFSRSVKKNFPGWTFQEAANGETALRLAENTDFDLIFLVSRG